MGGYNSGRTGGSRCTDSFRSLDVRMLQSEKLLQPGTVFNLSWPSRNQNIATIEVSVDHDCVVLRYQLVWKSGEQQSCTNTIEFDWTPCHYGGRRPWWLCPSCDRRVAILYCCQSWYACRHCFGLAYRSQRETAEDLAARRVDKLRKRLGWQAGIFNSSSGKPKGMHWRTYYRLRSIHDRKAGPLLAGILPSIRGGNRC